MTRIYSSVVILILLGQGFPVLAQSTAARCELYRRGSDQPDKVVPCTVSRYQGAVTIAREDGVTHELLPLEGNPGMFRDDYGFLVIRKDDLGSAGLIFRFEDKSVYVYWDNASALSPEEPGDANRAGPYTTADYDATVRLRCGSMGVPVADGCPAGIRRMDEGQISIVVTSPVGEEFTINIMRDHVNASGRNISAILDGDTWLVNVDGEETYEVPLAALEGG